MKTYLKGKRYTFALFLSWLLFLPTSYAAEPIRTELQESCRKSAGFSQENWLSETPTSNAISICRKAFSVNGSSPIVAAYLGRALYYNGEYGEAYSTIKIAADAGYPIGLTLLGVLHEYGYGTQQSNTEAAKWYQRGADKGDPNALYNLALLALSESASSADVPTAKVFLAKAAVQNYPAAWNLQAWLIRRGIGTSADPEQADALYRLAADKGLSDAQYNWAVLHLESKTNEALSYLRKAAAKKHKDAMALLGELLMRGRLLPRDETHAIDLLLEAQTDSRRARWVLGVARDGKKWPPLLAINAQRTRPIAYSGWFYDGLLEQKSEFEGKITDDVPWNLGQEPSEWQRCERLFARVGSHAILRRRAAAAYELHSYFDQIGIDAARELLADALSDGQSTFINDGARQVAGALQLESLNPTFPKSVSEYFGNERTAARLALEKPIKQSKNSASAAHKSSPPWTTTYTGPSLNSGDKLPDLRDLNEWDAETAKPLLAAASSDSDPQVQQSLLRILGNWRILGFDQFIRDQLNDSNFAVRHLAIRAASVNKLDLSSAQISALLNADERALVLILKYSRGTSWNLPEEAIVRALNSTNEDLRRAGLYAARGKPNSKVRTAIVGLMNYEDFEIRSDAVSTLSDIRLGKEVIPLINSMTDTEMDHPDMLSFLKCRAVRTTSPSAINEELSTILLSAGTLRRKQALWAIGCIGSSQLTPVIERLALTDPDPTVRRLAIAALDNKVAGQSLSTLITASDDKNPTVRRAALNAVVDIPTRQEIATKLSTDPDEAVRADAATILREQESPDTLRLLEKLSRDSSAAVRENALTSRTSISEQDRARLTTLAPTARTDELCRLRKTENSYVFDALLTVVFDRRADEETRSRALYCAQGLASMAVTAERANSISTAVFDPTNTKLAPRLLQILSASNVPDVLTKIVRYGIEEGAYLGGECNSLIAKFPRFEKKEAIQPYLRHKNGLVRLAAANCMGADRSILTILMGRNGDRQDAISADTLKKMVDIDTPETAPFLIQALSRTDDENDRSTLQQALWMTRSQLAYDNALAYRGRLPVNRTNFITAWITALKFRPDAAALHRLMAEIPRDIGDGRLFLGAIEISAAVPDAELDTNQISLIADAIFKQEHHFERREEAKTFSPLAFLATCIAVRDNSEQAREIDFSAWDTTRVLQSQHVALRRVVSQCEEYWRARKSAPSLIVRGWAIRLLLDAGLVSDAVIFPASAVGSGYSAPVYIISLAEALAQHGEGTRALQLLDELDARWLKELGSIDRKAYFYNRISLIRGLVAMRANDYAAARARFQTVANLDIGTTSIIAFGLGLHAGAKGAVRRARLLADEWNISRMSGPLAVEAMDEILSFLVLFDARSGNLEQSLLNADRLAALHSFQFKPLSAILPEADKSDALRQIKEFETRILKAGSKKAGVTNTGLDEEDLDNVSSLRQQFKIWLTELRFRYPTMINLLAPEQVEIEQVKRALGGDRVLVQYILLQNQSIVWVLTNEGGSVLMLPHSESTIREWVTQARGLLTDALIDENERAQGERALRMLSDALVAPVLKLAGERRHWVLIPHASLHALPFAALKDRNGVPLIVTHTLSFADSSSSLYPNKPAAPTSGNKLLIVGNPDGTTTRGVQLDEAELEAKRISEIVKKNVQVEVGHNAKLGLLVGQNLESTALHLAVHGQVQAGDKSRLTFSDGYLTVRDVWALSLSGSPRVVLSACESGVGETLIGNEVLSLANGFLFAGTSSVVASLWKVPDSGTARLMESLYSHLEAGQDTVEALASAQRSMISQNAPPSDWAAFVVHAH